MNDPATVQRDHTKKYQIPLSHLEHRYIHQCTDGFELERIYKELISGQEGSHPILAQFTLERLQNILPDSQLLRQNPSTSVILNGTTPTSNEEWRKFQETVSHEFSSDEDESLTKNRSYELNKRLHTAEQHRLNADTALKLNNHQQSIDLYTKSISLEPNLLAYINRAIAYFKLNKFDASIEDCSHILSIDSKNINGLIYRAQCYLAKQQYDQAKQDLNDLLSIDPENNEAQDLMNTIIALGKTNIQSAIFSDTREDQVDHSMNIDRPPRENSPTEFGHRNTNPFQISSLNDDDDDDDEMALGDEAGGVGGLGGNLSEDEGHISHSINVSPTIDEDSDTHELTTQKILNESIDHSIAFQIDDNTKTNPISKTTDYQINDDVNELYDHPDSSYQQHMMRSNDETYNQNSSIYDAISNSNFGAIVQSWLRDLVTLQSNRRYYDRPWSKSSRPWSLDKIQHDIEKFSRFNDYRNAIEVSKKLLQNGILDYHYYAEYLSETLTTCAKCYSKLQDYSHAIQYATEALQYDRKDSEALICRGKAFENEKFLFFSYADYSRVPSSDFNYHLIQNICQKLINELNSTEGELWREKLPNDQNDAERYVNYLKLKTNYSEENCYEWYQTYADQFYLDACFVLAIRFYTVCIELQPDIKHIYLKRAACYLKVFEPQKVISDCEIILKEDDQNFLALYYKASAYKIARDYHAYELTLRTCLKLQPNNQIILAEYHTYRHEQIPRKKRRIRTRSIDENNLTYEELEQIRLDKINPNASLDSKDIKEQCSFILHLQSLDSITIKLIEMVVNTSRAMIQTEENYHQEHESSVLSFSYIKYCFDILIQLATLPQIDSVLSMMEDNYRILLNELISYYSTRFDDVEKLNRLKRL